MAAGLAKTHLMATDPCRLPSERERLCRSKLPVCLCWLSRLPPQARDGQPVRNVCLFCPGRERFLFTLRSTFPACSCPPAFMCFYEPLHRHQHGSEKVLKCIELQWPWRDPAISRAGNSPPLLLTDTPQHPNFRHKKDRDSVRERYGASEVKQAVIEWPPKTVPSKLLREEIFGAGGGGWGPLSEPLTEHGLA